MYVDNTPSLIMVFIQFYIATLQVQQDIKKSYLTFINVYLSGIDVRLPSTVQ